MICDNCKNEIIAGKKFCGFCGVENQHKSSVPARQKGDKNKLMNHSDFMGSCIDVFKFLLLAAPVMFLAMLLFPESFAPSAGTTAEEIPYVGGLETTDRTMMPRGIKVLPTLTTLPPEVIRAMAPQRGTFHGYSCLTLDCSGHEAGYDWAEENNISDEYGCDGNSNSFNEGCIAYIEENY